MKEAIIAIIVSWLLFSGLVGYACCVVSGRCAEEEEKMDIKDIPVGKRFGSTVAEPTVEGVWHE